MAITKVGIVGCGAMGLGTAQVTAHSGLETTAVKATPGSTDAVWSAFVKRLARAVEKGKITSADKDAVLGLTHFTGSESDLADCDLVIESVIEDLDTKRALFARLEGIVAEQALLTTNTSALSVTAMMSACERRDRGAGLHLFHPAPAMKLIEIVRAFETSDATVSTLREFCRRLGKEPVVVHDTPGFIVNRLLTPYLLSAVRLLEMGTGSIATIDKAIMTGAGHRMGPFAVADYIGLDIVSATAENLYEDMHMPHLSVPHTLKRLVQLGYLGRKTGKGFYDYSVQPPIPNPALKRPIA